MASHYALLKASQSCFESPTLPGLRAEAERKARGPLDGSFAGHDSASLSANRIILSRLLGTADEAVLAHVEQSRKGAGLLNMIRFTFAEHALALSRYSCNTLTAEDVETLFNATGSSMVDPQLYALLGVEARLPREVVVKAFKGTLDAIDAAHTELHKNAMLGVALFLILRLKDERSRDV